MRRYLGLALTAAVLAGAGAAVHAQEAPKSIKIGYVISLSGPQSAGAMLTTVPNYRLWVDEVNKAGGLMLKKYNKKIPIEVAEIDDRSNNEDMVRLVERLMSVDKVDLVLAPWGTGPNLQAAPTFNKYGYPQIMGTAATDKIPELAPRFGNAFWLLGRPSDGVTALVELLSDLKKKGQVKETVALFTVQHPFGSEFLTPAKPALDKAGFKIVYETSYPLGVADLSAQGIEVIYDDRRGKVSPGVKFKDAELIGVPTIVTVGRGLADGNVEVRDRRTGEREEVAVGSAVARITEIVRSYCARAGALEGFLLVMPQRQIDAVRHVLREVAGEREASLPRELLVVNKIDAADPLVLAQLRVALPEAVFVSAHSREGVDELLARMTELITAGDVQVTALLPYDRGDLVARIHAEGTILSTEHGAEGTRITARVPGALAGLLAAFVS